MRVMVNLKMHINCDWDSTKSNLTFSLVLIFLLEISWFLKAKLSAHSFLDGIIKIPFSPDAMI